MKYISTRGGIAPIEFSDALMMGLATDGGLLLPEVIPNVRTELGNWRNLRYQDLAVEILCRFIAEDDIPRADLVDLVERSYRSFAADAITPIIKTQQVYIQEMFHGPTLAFKDLALQLLGNLFEYTLARNGEHLNILAATSGDTGSAAIHGVRGRDRINIFVLHPHQRVSALQERQMTTVLDDNVYNIAIQGTFDDGQNIIKELFADLPFKNRYALGAVNSVNWARVLAQIVYYFYGAFRVCEREGCDDVNFCVPTGNFGNIFAGYMACRMGAPIRKLILATNENDILSRFLASGVYKRGDVHPSLSPSMDIQVASNFERYLYYQLGEDGGKVLATMQDFRHSGEIRPAGVIAPIFDSGAADTETTLKTIARVHQDDGYILDPHSAVGVAVAYRLSESPVICLATAHPAKFPDAVKQASGVEIHHPALDKLSGLPTRCTILPAERAAIQEYLETALS